MALDIAEMLFVDILRMTNYPTLASGNILQDVVMLFFIPTVIIIVFVYLILEALKILDNKKIKLLFGIAMYLFIIFSGYYGTFAALSGPYMVLVIFVFGILYFIIGHFRGHKGGGETRTGHGPASAAYRATEERAIADMPGRIRTILGVPTLDPAERTVLENEEEELGRRITAMEHRMDKALAAGSNVDPIVLKIDELEAQVEAIKEKLHGSRHRGY